MTHLELADWGTAADGARVVDLLVDGQLDGYIRGVTPTCEAALRTLVPDGGVMLETSRHQDVE